MAKHESDRKKFASNLWVKIICGFLAFLMVGAVIFELIYALK